MRRWAGEHDIAAGMPLETLRRQVGLPAAELVPKLLQGTGFEVADGLVRAPGARPASTRRCARSRRGWPPSLFAPRRPTNSPGWACAAGVLAGLPQPFTVSEARRALGSRCRCWSSSTPGG